MAIRVQKDGSFEIEYSGPFGGLNVQDPEILMPDKDSPATNGFQFRNSELRSIAAFSLAFQGMDRINPALGTYSFLDANGVTHSVGFNARGLWQLAPAGQPAGSLAPWAILGGPELQNNIPISYRTFANILYYTNGGPQLIYWDGMTIAPVFQNSGVAGSTSIAAISTTDAPTVIPGSTGPLSIGGYYLGELDNHILLANVVVIDDGTQVIYRFPNRLWWSANGLPLQWDPVANTNAGFNDFLDVPDFFTGLITIGVSGYLFRTNGITFFTTTGSGLTPFQFDHLWASDNGIGNVFPWSISQYGSIACFIATDNVYQMGVSSFEPVGGKARDAIMADLALASGNPVASVVPTDVQGYVYLTYRISIPLTSFTRTYVYDIEAKNWAVWDTPNLLVTGRCETVWTGILSNFGTPGVVPPSTGKSGGGGTGGGGSPTGGGCFTGNVRIYTTEGLRRFDELREPFIIMNRNGMFEARLIVHENYTDTMLDMGEGQLVTKDHGILSFGDWLTAETIWDHLPRIENWTGTVYNLHIVSENPEDAHYILENGEAAHNFQPKKPFL